MWHMCGVGRKVSEQAFPSSQAWNRHVCAAVMSELRHRYRDELRQKYTLVMNYYRPRDEPPPVTTFLGLEYVSPGVASCRC